MSRFIDADKFLDNFNDEIEMGISDYSEAVNNALDNTATADVTLVIHGSWILDTIFPSGVELYKCSNCGRTISYYPENEDLSNYPYCHCGVRMDEVIK